jgi:hypothetical protein
LGESDERLVALKMAKRRKLSGESIVVWTKQPTLNLRLRMEGMETRN